MSIPKNPHPKTHRGRFVGQGMIDNPEYRAWQECAAAIVKWGTEDCPHMEGYYRHHNYIKI